MLRQYFTLFFLCKREDRIYMPRRLVDNLEGKIVNEELHECALWYDILSADLNSEDSLLPNIREHRIFGVAHDVSRFICSNGIGKILKSFFNVCAELVPALICDGNEALRNVHGIHRAIVVDRHRLFSRFGVEDSHWDLLSPLISFFLQICFYILTADDIPMRFCRSDLARNNPFIQHPLCFALGDMEQFIKLFLGDDLGIHFPFPPFCSFRVTMPWFLQVQLWRSHPGAHRCPL